MTEVHQLKEISTQLNYDVDQFALQINTPESPVQTDFDHQDKYGRSTILIVEDHVDIRDYIQSSISDHYNTRIATNGKTALKILHQENIDLIISDLMMPWMDGFELLERIKTDDDLKNIPVMIVSARTGQEDRSRVLGLGVNDFLIKPFKREELLARIQNLIQKQEGKI